MSEVFRHDNFEVTQVPGGFRVTEMRTQKAFFVRLVVRFRKSAPGPCSCGSAESAGLCMPAPERRQRPAPPALSQQSGPQRALPPPGTAYAEIRTQPAPPAARLFPRPACRTPALPPLRPHHHGGGLGQAGREATKGVTGEKRPSRGMRAAGATEQLLAPPRGPSPWGDD